MKTLFFLAAIGGLAYWRYTDVPAIQITSVDWDNQKITTSVRGNSVVIDASSILNSGSTMLVSIPFSKYGMTVSQNSGLSSSSSVVRISILDGKASICQPVYVDFDMQLVNGHQFEPSK